MPVTVEFLEKRDFTAEGAGGAGFLKAPFSSVNSEQYETGNFTYPIFVLD